MTTAVNARGELVLLGPWFVHYTVGGKQHMSAGPYNTDEVLTQKLDITTYAHVTDVYVSEQPKHPKGN